MALEPMVSCSVTSFCEPSWELGKYWNSMRPPLFSLASRPHSRTARSLGSPTLLA